MTDTRELSEALDDRLLKEKLLKLREEREAKRKKKEKREKPRRCKSCSSVIEKGEIRSGDSHAQCEEHTACYVACVESHTKAPIFLIPAVEQFYKDRKKDSGITPRQAHALSWMDYMKSKVASKTEKTTIARDLA